MKSNNTSTSIHLKDILNMIKIIPKTLSLIKSIHKKNFYIIIVLSTLLGVCPIISLLCSQNLLNVIGFKNMQVITYAIIYYILAKLLNQIITSLTEYYQGRFSYLISYKINLKIMTKCSKLSLQHFENSDIYDKLQRIQNEATYKPYEIFLSILSIITSSITVISSIIILINWKPWVLIILIIIPVTFSLYFFKIAQREFNVNWQRASNRRKSWYLSYLLTKDITFKEVRIYNLSDYILKKFKNINNLFVKQDIKLLSKRISFTFVFEIIEQICLNIILILIVYSAVIGEILIGNVVGLINSLNLISNNIKSTLNTIYSLYKNNLYINQLFDFLELKEESDIIDNLSKRDISSIRKLKISNLSFRYPTNSRMILKNINLEINQKERIAIVGPNGSGKSTLIKLILKLYSVDDNSIYINDYNINDYKIDHLRNCYGILFQDFVKYELSVKENIAFGDIENISNLNKIKQSMNKAKINFLNDVNTQLGLWFEDGIQLSGGQWQKIAIARAFFRDASMYILDEPSSSLDPISEKEIIKMFLDITKNKIGIFVSHRLSTAMLADKIIVIEDGSITGHGTHTHLLETNDTYKLMYKQESLQYNL